MATGYPQEAVLERLGRNVLEHPFLARWARGELSFADLALYASEYDHAVTAIAAAAKRAAAIDPRLSDDAARESCHLSRWRDFSRAVGWGGMAAWTYAEDPLASTLACVRVWEGEAARTVAEHRRTLNAIEAVQAPVCEVMLAGLLRHYGFDAGPETEYFRIHAAIDSDSPVGVTDDVHDSLWSLLDGVEGLTRS